MIDSSIINQIKSSLNIVDVVSTFVTLKRKGTSYVGICPFHDDSHPSMTVNEAHQFYKCFVCDAGGDVIDFVQRYHNMTFPEAIEWCCRQAGLEYKSTEQSPEDIERAKKREAQYIAIAAAGQLFKSHLHEAQTFLLKRGYDISSKTLKDYSVGYAAEGNMAVNEMSRAGYNLGILNDVGIINFNDAGKPYDVFRDRVMFPFHDLQGRVIGFTGRFVTPKDGTGKYVNTRDTELFKKGDNFYGLTQARNSISKCGFVYIVEGQFDVLSMHEMGIENVIAGSGTAFTSTQVKLLHRFTQSAVFIYDDDKAGLHAALRNCELLVSAGITVRCIKMTKGMDPDNFAQKNREKTSELLTKKIKSFPSYFNDCLIPKESPAETVEKGLVTILKLIAHVQSQTLQLGYLREVSKIFKTNTEILENRLKEVSREIKISPVKEKIKEGIYGLDLLKEQMVPGEPAILTGNFNKFIDRYGDNPIVYINGKIEANDILQLRRICNYFITEDDEISISRDGNESDYMIALSQLYTSGITDITVNITDKHHPIDDDEEDYDHIEDSYSYINYYVYIYGKFLRNYHGERTPFIQRCAEMLSYADKSLRIINYSNYYTWLGITKGQLNDILKPHIDKRESYLKINGQRDDPDEYQYDPNEIPSYVDEVPEYSEMYKQCGYYPRLNKQKEPVCYIFHNERGGNTQVGDFYMKPLLHIYNDDYEANKRVLKINRRYYDTPIYIEVLSKALLKKSSIEEVLINLEAVNFTNGEEKHWTKIREYMSRHFITCSEIQVYGNQQTEGTSRKEDTMFYAFANGIYHLVDGTFRFDMVDELGVVKHNNKNYYLPAYSTIYAGNGRTSDKYELISQLTYKEVPKSKQVTFEKWANLMDKVYRINDNGKWALLYAIMCAFRSNIHCIDRIFTAPFFMGPMSSGKTQIAISIRSLFIAPNVPIFNLNTGTDAAMSTMMGSFRDVPVVLDEYNNKDISDIKFQALKGIVYDGDGKQKRKGVSGREIENDKVYTPVVICGQETPQRDDNALMSRIIVCEVPKPKDRTAAEVKLFEELKDIEDPEKIGLSNVLLQILQLRPAVMDHYAQTKRQCYEQLKQNVINSGEMDRLMKTASLFLGMCKLIELYSPLKLPFTYEEFFKIAQTKIKTQLEMIRKTDKLAVFFKAMDVMIDTHSILEGREFSIDTPDSITITQPGGDKKTVAFDSGTHVLFLRLSGVYTQFARSSFNSEDSTQSTIEQNLRSHPSYIGIIHARRFNWNETMEVPRDESEMMTDNTMVRKVVKKSTNSSCIALNYDVFKELYDIDLQREDDEDSSKSNIKNNSKSNLPFPPSIQQDLPL